MKKTHTKATMKKQVRVFNGKKLFLLGKGANDEKFYLNEATWDCDWYWGFGYVKTFEKYHKDWSSHTHIKDNFIGQQTIYDWHNCKHYLTDYVYNIYDNKKLVETTFSKEEGWKLSELFNQYYYFRSVSDMLHCGGTNTTKANTEQFAGGEDIYKTINEVYLPNIFKQIEDILTPKPRK